jgi:NADH dehydrogenase
LEADVVLWAAHSRAWPLCGNTARAGVDGRVVVDPYLQAEGLSRVFVAGDTALAYDYVHDRVASSSAQLAVQQGALVARNLAAALEGRPLREYRPHILGEALSLGRDGAAEVGGVVVTGRAALAVKEAALVRYLRSLGGVRFVSEYA